MVRWLDQVRGWIPGLIEWVAKSSFVERWLFDPTTFPIGWLFHWSLIHNGRIYDWLNSQIARDEFQLRDQTTLLHRTIKGLNGEVGFHGMIPKCVHRIWRRIWKITMQMCLSHFAIYCILESAARRILLLCLVPSNLPSITDERLGGHLPSFGSRVKPKVYQVHRCIVRSFDYFGHFYPDVCTVTVAKESSVSFPLRPWCACVNYVCGTCRATMHTIVGNVDLYVMQFLWSRSLESMLLIDTNEDHLERHCSLVSSFMHPCVSQLERFLKGNMGDSRTACRLWSWSLLLKDDWWRDMGESATCPPDSIWPDIWQYSNSTQPNTGDLVEVVVMRLANSLRNEFDFR